MINRNNVLVCDWCKKPIERLPEEIALGDIEGHGWTNYKTAIKHACYHCSHSKRVPYETYIAGRFRDLTNGERKVYVGGGWTTYRNSTELEQINTYLNKVDDIEKRTEIIEL